MTEELRDRMARLADVAMAAGVSQGTVSNVFNHPELVRPEVRERVHDAARSVGYKGPDPRGRLLRAGRVNAIGVATDQPLTHFFRDPFARALMIEIAEACEASGTGISLVSSTSEEALSWNLSNALVDGLILFCLSGADRLIASCRERRLPFVALAFGDEKGGMSVIDVDNVDGGRKAATHLADLGHRRFAILSLELTPGHWGRRTRAEIDTALLHSGRDRIHGNFEALAARGIEPDEIAVFETLADEKTVHPALEALFSDPRPPTAIIAQSDLIAMITMEWLTQHGMRVPGDVSIIGFDGVPESALTSPPLTTIAQPIRDIGQQAVRAILDQTDTSTNAVFDTELLVRGSTAPPKPDA